MRRARCSSGPGFRNRTVVRKGIPPNPEARAHWRDLSDMLSRPDVKRLSWDWNSVLVTSHFASRGGRKWSEHAVSTSRRLIRPGSYTPRHLGSNPTINDQQAPFRHENSTIRQRGSEWLSGPSGDHQARCFRHGYWGVCQMKILTFSNGVGHVRIRTTNPQAPLSDGYKAVEIPAGLRLIILNRFLHPHSRSFSNTTIYFTTF